MSEDGSWFGSIGDTYNMLWKIVIRPPRDLYGAEELGPQKFRLGKRIFERRDLQLTGHRGVLQCSHFLPAKDSEMKRPCVVYLHGNCSSRLEAFDVLPVLLPRDMTVFSLDLSGSGRSDGEYISLGHHEEKDLCAVLQHLRELPCVSTIGIWGRSMGATTCCLRAAEDLAVAACVMDSAFCDLRTVAEELANCGRLPIPNALIGLALDVIKSEVQSRAEFDPWKLSPITTAPFASAPALFAVAWDDSFVLPHHTQELHDAWGGERQIRVFDGGHNGVRPAWFLDEAADFLLDNLKAAAARPVASSWFDQALWQRVLTQADIAAGPSPAMPSHTSRPVSSRPSLPTVSPEQEMREDALVWLQSKQAQEALLADQMCPPDGVRRNGLSDLLPYGDGDDSPKVNCPKSMPAPYPAEVNAAVGLQASRQALDQASHQKDSLPLQTRDKAAAPFYPKDSTAGPSLTQQLISMGFDATQAAAASRRSLGIEAAVDWLSTQKSTVRL